MNWLLNLLFGPTKAERACCHMSAAGRRDIRQWRAEFAGMDRSEHCRDCPAISPASRATAAGDAT